VNTRAAAVQALDRTLGHGFRDPDLLERALTHASVGEGAARIANNEVLEFIGDRVLGLLVAETLAARHPKASEGELARRLNRLVSRDTCALVGEAIGIGPALRMSGSATRIGARERGSVLAGGVEAVIAAVYADGGLEAARALFLRLWAPYLDQDVGAIDRRDPKTALQEWAHASGVASPVYTVLNREGPDHAPVFLVQLQVAGREPVSARGPSRREAEKRAAEALLTREGVQ
jgi:ribonuclease-3